MLLKQSEISLYVSHLQAKDDPLSAFSENIMVQMITDLIIAGSSLSAGIFVMV